MVKSGTSVDNFVSSTLEERIYQVTRQIPAGRVATYGQIALVAGAGSARLVGRAMATLPTGSDVPWHRVINSQGKISARRDGGFSPEQKRRLRREGVLLDRQGRVDVAAVGWSGPSWQWLEANGYDIESLILRSQAKGRRGAWVNWKL
ncbi:MAG: MGMT family protein [Alphaproteobacteria bacterium]|jgi:methylated-DNA-protein-cysteine methyltransferase-like protein|nr:MGMT family protein [Alphaproteobacteria bacterium]